MRRLLFILLILTGINTHAVDYAPWGTTRAALPATTMPSVNDAEYMTSGSAYSSSVYDVGSSGPAAATAVRKSPPSTSGTTTTTTYDPGNPQFGSIGEAVVPLLVMTLIYVLALYRRRHARQATDI